MVNDKSLAEWEKSWGLDKVKWRISNTMSVEEIKWAFDLLGWDKYGRDKKRRRAK